jgi:hypothetical protein
MSWLLQHLCLGGYIQGLLRRNGFAGIQPAAGEWFSERGGILMVFGTSKKSAKVSCQ